MSEITALAAAFKEYGPWALTAMFAIALGTALKMMRADSKSFVILVREIMTVTAASTAASNAMAEAGRGIEAGLSTISKSVDSLAREQEVELKDIRHTVGGQASSLEGIVRVLDKQASSLADTAKNVDRIATQAKVSL